MPSPAQSLRRSPSHRCVAPLPWAPCRGPIIGSAPGPAISGSCLPGHPLLPLPPHGKMHHPQRSLKMPETGQKHRRCCPCPRPVFLSTIVFYRPTFCLHAPGDRQKVLLQQQISAKAPDLLPLLYRQPHHSSCPLISLNLSHPRKLPLCPTTLHRAICAALRRCVARCSACITLNATGRPSPLCPSAP